MRQMDLDNLDIHLALSAFFIFYKKFVQGEKYPNNTRMSMLTPNFLHPNSFRSARKMCFQFQRP